MPTDTRGRYKVLEWLMFQMASVGPNTRPGASLPPLCAEAIRYAIDRYTSETKRIYGVIDKRVGEVPYLAGEYSIADIATYPWLKLHKLQGQNLKSSRSETLV